MAPRRKHMPCFRCKTERELATKLLTGRWHHKKMQPEQAPTLFLIYLLLNTVVFCVYWWDKQAAIEGAWRVSENTLLTLAFFGGSLGAVTAQQTLRHKTHKEPFRSNLMTIAGLHVILAGFWLFAPPGTLATVLDMFEKT